MAHPDRLARALLATPLVLTLTLAGTSACSSTPTPAAQSSAPASTSVPPNVYEQQRTDGVNALLKRFTAALTSGDRGKLDALIDPLAGSAFRRSLYTAQDDLGPTPAGRTRTAAPTATSARPTPEQVAPGSASRTDPGAVTVPGSGSAAPRRGAAPAPRGVNLVLRTLDYRVAPTDGPERLVGGALGVKLTEQGSTDSWVTPVTVSYALGGTVRPGVDEPVIDVPAVLAFSRYGEDWKLLGDGSLAPDPWVDPEEPVEPPALTPWTFAGLQADDVATAGGASAVLSYPGTDATVDKVRRELGPAVTAVSDFWGDQWSRRTVVMATGDEKQWSGLTRTAPGATSAAAAATVFSRIDRGKRVVVGQRIVLAPSAAQLSDAGLAVVLRHELAHVATRLETAEKAPMWLTEGVAEYVGRRGQRASLTDAAPELAAAVAAGRVPAALPVDKDFAVNSQEARIAYQSAWSFAAFVAAKYGDGKLRDLYRAVGGGEASKQDAAFTRILGADEKAVVGQWQTWLRRQVR